MKVLVISHNVFCKTSSMGKTLMAYFSNWDSCDLAQFYIHSEIPTDDMCLNYYRITDKEIIESIITRRSGKIFGKKDIAYESKTSRTDSGLVAKLYARARKKTPLLYFMREVWWLIGAWKTNKFMNWIDDFDPDAVFFASGDSAFMYRISLEIAKSRKIPLVIACMDDYYIFNKNQGEIFGRIIHRRFMKQVHTTMAYASCVFTICDKMNEDYGKLFNKPCCTIHTPASFAGMVHAEKSTAISYIGNMGLNRNQQIEKLGKALMRIESDIKPRFIDVYSFENRPEIVAGLTEENGIRFHGGITAEKVNEVMCKSLALVHTESFDANMRRRVAYSVSTKIADSLASGTCILAYGPEEIASIKYLSENQAAYCIVDDMCLEERLAEFLRNSELRDRIANNAQNLAKNNHNLKKNCDLIKNRLEMVIRDSK